ncbi:hypothetical protein GCK72_013881 [Caenorhabditis remanei]|uniref:C-type lectin domain-containing protein n=1 Tax=Caenorhabditis remanei TaxID=31234 RepID=A0A6A5GSA6_CAERE|nr:hypothetical protein GCK72_013881 [Caenorhabditis remanei]KAF1757425.1 hypothetical protein GCK72_013881 [Caenorhabditis remanei]
MFSSMYGTSIAIFAIHFVYRYVTVTGHSLQSTFVSWKFIIWLFFPFVFGLLWSVVINLTLTANPAGDLLLEQEYLSKTNHSINQVSYIGTYFFPRTVNGTNYFSVRPFIGIGCMLAANFVSIMVILSYGYKCYIHMKTVLPTTSQSSQFKNLQTQLFYALFFQTLIPIILMHTPAFFIFIATFMDRSCELLGQIPSITIVLYPSLDPLPNIFIIRNYRDATICELCAELLANFNHISDYVKSVISLTTSNPSAGCETFERGTYTTNFNNTSNLTRYSYSTQLLKNGSWSYTYKISKVCPSKWVYFKRSLGEWCVRLYSEYLNQTEATKKCEKQGAVLTGLESTAERDYLWNIASTTFNVDGLTKVWINGVRRKGCQLIGVKQFPAGCGGLAGFNFTDKQLSKKEGLSWTEHNPDGLRYELSDIYQDCLVMWIRPNQKLIDDVLCNSYLDPNGNEIRGYACGKEAG